ncbi:TPA: hypothetical protein N0F65_011136, partial [Lagenidium giganteum]
MTFCNGDAYAYNDQAASLVQTQFQYITESIEDGPLVSTGLVCEPDKTATVIYEYVLELEEEANVVGGEWVGESMKAHPDFLWVPQPIDDDQVTKNQSVRQERARVAQPVDRWLQPLSSSARPPPPPPPPSPPSPEPCLLFNDAFLHSFDFMHCW